MRGDDRHGAFYAWLLRRYPRPFRDRFSAAMEQTFAEMRADRRASGRRVSSLLASVYLDTSIGLIREHAVNGVSRVLAAPPRLAALLGALLVLPFFGLNLVVVNRVDPLFSWIRPGVQTGPFEYPILLAVLLLIPLGAAIALAPARHLVQGRRRIPVLNAVIAVLLIAGFVTLSIALGDEIVRCDVLQIKNCD
jgi:hypothetical protein